MCNETSHSTPNTVTLLNTVTLHILYNYIQWDYSNIYCGSEKLEAVVAVVGGNCRLATMWFPKLLNGSYSKFIDAPHSTFIHMVTSYGHLTCTLQTYYIHLRDTLHAPIHGDLRNILQGARGTPFCQSPWHIVSQSDTSNCCKLLIHHSFMFCVA